MDENLINELIQELRENKIRESDEIHLLKESITKITKLLIGNGEIGLCERVRRINGNIKPLWFLVSTIGVLLAGGVITLILK